MISSITFSYFLLLSKFSLSLLMSSDCRCRGYLSFSTPFSDGFMFSKQWLFPLKNYLKYLIPLLTIELEPSILWIILLGKSLLYSFPVCRNWRILSFCLQRSEAQRSSFSFLKKQSFFSRLSCSIISEKSSLSLIVPKLCSFFLNFMEF